jgi:hypothetical protein
MSKQTAVEWLVEELFKKIDYIQVDPRIIDHAIAMEREQIIEAYHYDENFHCQPNDGEKYYIKTYSK